MNKIILRQILILLFVFFSRALYAVDIEVDILNKSYKALPLLMSKFYTTEETEEIFDNVASVIYGDLQNSGVFDVTTSKEMLVKKDIDINTLLEVTDITAYKPYVATVVGKVTYNKKMEYYTLEVGILNNEGVFLNKIGYKIHTTKGRTYIDNIAHDISNEIYKSITGLDGYFSLSLTFASANHLMLSDYDGNNQQMLVELKGKAISPVFSHDGTLIAYADFYQGTSMIYLYDIYFKKTMKLANFKGIALSPSFSVDDKILMFSIAHNGSTHVYKASLDEGKLEKITNGYTINISGDFSYDNTNLVFNSNRSGSPKIYVMDVDGNGIKRISNEAGSYYTPSFSPNANIILFTKIIGRKFNIGVMNLQGVEKIISEDILAESPSWLLDGRHIIYQYTYKNNQSGDKKYSFYIMDLLSGYKFLVKPTEDAQDPSVSYIRLVNKKISAKYSF